MSKPNWPAIDQAIEVLNSIAAIDHIALAKVLEQEVTCLATMQNHPTLQVAKAEGLNPPHFTVLGLINSLFGWDPRGFAYIAAHYDLGRLLYFRRTDQDKFAPLHGPEPFSREAFDAVRLLLGLLDQLKVVPAVATYYAALGNPAPPQLLEEAIAVLTALYHADPAQPRASRDDSLMKWQRYAFYCRSCALSGEVNPQTFEEFCEYQDTQT